MNNAKNSMMFEKIAVGREQETVRLEKILLNSRVCIINGMAGVGKTFFAKQFSRSHNSVVYISDYRFHSHNLQNRVVEHSFIQTIKPDSILIIDDIEENIDLYIWSVFFRDLQKLSPKNIILITRQNNIKSEVPILTLQPFTVEQTYALIKNITNNKYPDTEIEQIVRMSCGNPVMVQVICSLLDNYSNMDEIWEQLSLEQNKRLIYPFIHRNYSVPRLKDSEIQTYVEILIFGKIEICLLKHWDSRSNVEITQDINSLITKGIISSDGISVYGDYSIDDNYLKYPYCYDYCISIANNMRDDILNGRSVEDKYANAIISTLKYQYEFVDFIVTFYKQKIALQKQLDFTDTLTQILQRMGRIEDSLNKSVIPQISIIDRNIKKLVSTQEEIQTIIGQLAIELKDNEKALDVLDELCEAVKNPQKTKWDRVNSCIGFLGSVATLVTFNVNGFTTNTNALIDQLRALVNVLPFIRS